MTAETPFLRDYTNRHTWTPTYLAAQGYAWEDWPVIPASGETKKALTRWRKGNDSERATVNPELVDVWWTKTFPSAAVAVETGSASGLFVLDVDGDEGHANLARLEAENAPLPLTLTATTPSGGRHLYFSYPGGKTQAGGFGEGLDTRGDGGYVLAPPSARPDGAAYEWVDADVLPAPAPGWLLALAATGSPDAAPTQDSGVRRVHVPVAEYVETAFADDVAAVRAAANGTRNHQLNIAAHNAGRRIAGDCQNEKDAVARLTAAAEAAGLDAAETGATIKSGLAAGAAKPLVVEYVDEPTGDEDAQVATRVAKLWVDEKAKRRFRAEVVAERNAKSRGSRQMDGAEFVLDVPPSSPVLWGHHQEALWVVGEALLLAGGDGVGKTTVAQQLAFRRLGIKDDLLNYPVEPADGRVLYLAMDRPDQAARSFARMLPKEVREDYRALLKERLCVWRGPVPVDVVGAPDALANWVHETFGSEVSDVFADSYKDLAPGLSDDAVGAGINSAMQEVLARGLNWVGIHHQRKASGSNPDPTELSDVYGSRWLTAGVGSVFMFVGRAGDRTVELRHLKQPAQRVGPLLVQHDHTSGRTRLVDQGCEPVDVLDAAGEVGATAKQVAVKVYGMDDTAARKRAERALNRLAENPDVIKHKAKSGGAGGSEPARYWLKKHYPGASSGGA